MKRFTIFLLLLILTNGLHAQTEKMRFYQKIMYEIFYHKPLRKQIKKSFKNNDDINLSKFIRKNMEGETPDKITALEETPFSMYMFLGFWYGCYKNNKDMEAKYFGVAYEYEHNNALSAPDRFLSEKIIKFYNRYNPCNSGYQITKLTDLRNLAKDKYQKAEHDLINNNKNYKEDSKKLQHEIKILYNESEVIINEIDSLKQLVKNKKITITGLTTTNYKKALQEAELFKQKGLNLPGTITKNLYGGAKLIAKDEVSTAPLEPAIVESGFKLGVFCSEKIKTSTEKIIKSVLKIVEFKEKYELVPSDYTDSVKITLKLTGKADGYRISKTNGISNMKYKENTPIYGTFTSSWEGKWKNKIKSKTFRNGTPINDDDLAFLRCLCSYNQAKKVLSQSFSFPEDNLKTEYTAKVFKNKGEQFRGVDIIIEINNLFAYNIEKIRIAQEKLKIIKEKIKEKEKEKKKIDDKIEENNHKLKARRKEIAEYVKSILKNKKKKKSKKIFFGIF